MGRVLQHPGSQRPRYVPIPKTRRRTSNTYTTSAFLEIAIDHPCIAHRYDNFEQIETCHAAISKAYRRYAYDLLQLEERINNAKGLVLALEEEKGEYEREWMEKRLTTVQKECRVKVKESKPLKRRRWLKIL